MKNFVKLNAFWKDDSSDLVDFHNALGSLGVIDEEIVIVDEDDSDGTGYFVLSSFLGELMELASENNIEIEVE